MVFILGLLAGSAISAVLARLKTGESWVSGRSHCPHCKKTLGFFELVPLVSWLAQRGHCRHCGKKIGWQYPALELLTGALFLAGFVLRFGFDPTAAFVAAPLRSALTAFRDFYALAILTVIFIFDLKEGLILDRVTLPAIVLLGALSLALGMSPLSLALGILLGAGFFALQFWISKGRWIGGGDIRLGALLGALLGPAALGLALLIAYVSGATIGLLLIAANRKKWTSRLAFGTFLSAAAVYALYFGGPTIRWYVGMF